MSFDQRHVTHFPSVENVFELGGIIVLYIPHQSNLDAKMSNSVIEKSRQVIDKETRIK